MKRISLVLPVLFVFLFALPCQAQNNDISSYLGGNYKLIFGGVGIPTGDFGEDNTAEAGLAETGFGLGFEMGVPVSPNGLYWIINGSVLYNGINEDVFEDAMGFSINLGTGYSVEFESFEFGKWWNFPVMTGIKYIADVSPEFSIYGELTSGINLVISPNIEYTGTVCDQTDCYAFDGDATYDKTISFGYGLGFGIIIKENFLVGFLYLNLGKPEINGEASLTVSGFPAESEEFAMEQSISVMHISAGVLF